MNGGVLGFNSEQIEALRDVINQTAQKAGENIAERLHDSIVVPMSEVWYAPEAVDFFKDFATTVASTGENIKAAFDLFRDGVQKAGQNWYENTKGTGENATIEAPVLKELDPVNITLNVSEIKSDNAGTVTIDEGAATSIAAGLGQVETAIKADLEGLASNLNAETAFIGNGQADALQECFTMISGEIHKIFKFLTEDTADSKSLQSWINFAASKYSDVSKETSNYFSAESNS